MSTLTPALEIILLSYLPITRDKAHITYLLGHEHAYGYKLSTPSHLLEFIDAFSVQVHCAVNTIPKEQLLFKPIV